MFLMSDLKNWHMPREFRETIVRTIGEPFEANGALRYFIDLATPNIGCRLQQLWAGPYGSVWLDVPVVVSKAKEEPAHGR